MRPQVIMTASKRKWSTDSVPIGYPEKCSSGEIRDVLRDLNEAFRVKTRLGKNNKFWSDLLNNLLESGKNELESRKKSAEKIGLQIGSNARRITIVNSEFSGHDIDIKNDGRDVLIGNTSFKGAKRGVKKRFSMDDPFVYAVVSVITLIVVSVILAILEEYEYLRWTAN